MKKLMAYLHHRRWKEFDFEKPHELLSRLWGCLNELKERNNELEEQQETIADGLERNLAENRDLKNQLDQSDDLPVRDRKSVV